MLGEIFRPDLEVTKFQCMMSQDNCKASRRKQSKPSRLLANEEVVDSTVVNQPSDVSHMEHSPLKTESNDGKDPVDLSTKNHQEDSAPSPNADAEEPAVEMEMVTFPCHSCGNVFASRSQQEQHIAEQHSSENLKTGLASVFPTAYHRLANELAVNPPAISSSTNTKPSDSTAINSTPRLSNSSSNPTKTSATVFQREAYCDICQREFCNKYFLKTHKANIHGIIDPNDPKFSSMGTPKSNQVAPGGLQNLQVKPEMKPSPNQKSGGESMEDFCEICQKHFCNKYYLKKHKMDVHNIRPDGKQPSASADNQDSRTSVPASNTSLPHLPMMVPPLNTTTMSNMFFINPFIPSMAAMSMVPPLMQPQFFMPNSSMDSAAARALTSSVSSQSENKESNNANISPDADSKDSKSDVETFCNLCKKEFCNTYFLKVHRANKHGIFDDQTPMAEPKDGRQSSDANNEVKKEWPSDLKLKSMISSEEALRKLSPVFGLTSTMSPSQMAPLTFDAMMAAKQADRINCDICNKELCNKYFLKAHKLKMHGIPPSPDKQDKRGSMNTTPTKDLDETRSVKTPDTGMGKMSSVNDKNVIDDTSPESLVRMGIDPEAYCNICKKEFCSKYFLRTHRLNMHGIRNEKETPRAARSAGSQAGGLVGSKNEKEMPRMPHTPGSQVESPTGGSNSVTPGSQASGPDMFQWRWKESASQSGKLAAGSDKFTWRWKEPANATRVYCDICNKELCNKYFLRTHKLNKHGVVDSSTPVTPTTAVDKPVAASSMIADLARATQQNVHTPSNPDSEYLSMRFEQNSVSRGSPVSGASSPLSVSEKTVSRDDACHICGMVFENKQAIEMHMRDEHEQEQTTPNPQSEVNQLNQSEHNISAQDDKTKCYQCSVCDYKTYLLANLHLHKIRRHGVSGENPFCKLCLRTFKHSMALLKHMKAEHSHLKSVFKVVDNKSVARKVKCNYCGERFLNRQLCLSHIRNSHGIKVTTLSDQPKKNIVFACDKCRFTCRSLKNLRSHQVIRHSSTALQENKFKENGGRQPLSMKTQSTDITMQEFALRGVSGADSFALTTVSLPVYKQVTEEVNVSFTLTPAACFGPQTDQPNMTRETTMEAMN